MGIMIFSLTVQTELRVDQVIIRIKSAGNRGVFTLPLYPTH